MHIKTCIPRAKTFQYSHLFNHCKPLYVHSPRTSSKKVTNISNLEHKNVPLHLDEHLAPMNRLHLQSFTLCLFIARISDSFLPQKNQQKGTHRNILQLLLIFCPQLLPSPPTPSRTDSTSTAACTTAADMNGSPGLRDTPSISFLAGGEVLWAFYLSDRNCRIECLLTRSAYKI